MVSVWVTNSAIIADGVVTLSNGRSLALSEIPGKNWNAKRISKLTTAVQALMDDLRNLLFLSFDDSDRLLSLAEFSKTGFISKYGGRMFIDGDSVVSRSDLISFTLVDGDLVPTVTAVR